MILLNLTVGLASITFGR